MAHLLGAFDRVRIINLVDRTDRRREFEAQIDRIGGPAANIAFFDAHRPPDAGAFPSLGARGCFESHLKILREARDAGVGTLLILEDDLNFAPDIDTRGRALFDALSAGDWSILYGAHHFDGTDRHGLVRMDPAESTHTSPFIAYRGAVIPALVDFLEAMRERPAGSPDFGPMHVDGAFAVFHRLHPEYSRYAAFPALGHQRSSRSDITPRMQWLDSLPVARTAAGLIRRALNAVR